MLVDLVFFSIDLIRSDSIWFDLIRSFLFDVFWSDLISFDIRKHDPSINADIEGTFSLAFTFSMEVMHDTNL